MLNAVAGVNYHFLEDGKYHGLIGFADITLAENVASSGSEFVFAKSGTIGLTAYKVIDPVVLSLKTSFRPALSRDVVGTKVDPGDTIFLNPSLAFAVNNELTLTGGLYMRFQGADEVGGFVKGQDRHARTWSLEWLMHGITQQHYAWTRVRMLLARVESPLA